MRSSPARGDSNTMYTVPTLTDYSASALDAASRDLVSSLEFESAAINSDNDYKIFRDRWLARKDGISTQINDLWLKTAPKEAKRHAGQLVNELKNKIQDKVDATLTRIQGSAAAGKLKGESLDISLPGIRRPL